MLTGRTIAEQHHDVLTFLHGDPDSEASNCRIPAEAQGDSLVFATSAVDLAAPLPREVAILVVHRAIAHLAISGTGGARCCFSVRSIPMAMAVLLRHFDHKAERFTGWGPRHPSALIHPTAVIGRDVVLGPYCVVGAGASIGDGALIGAHTVIECEARVGAGSILHPHVFIGAACEVGRRCEIHPHTTIGSDGFGYAKDSTGRPWKIPHLGRVVIGDEVEIGGNCSIDRATLTATYIRTGAKLDNICHIAHNCDLGENGFYTAGFMMAGSTTIGRNFQTGGNSVVSAHLKLADDVILAGRSTVTNDVPEAGLYGGYPLQPLREALKTLVSLGQLNAMRKVLQRLAKRPVLASPGTRRRSP